MGCGFFINVSAFLGLFGCGLDGVWILFHVFTPRGGGGAFGSVGSSELGDRMILD